MTKNILNVIFKKIKEIAISGLLTIGFIGAGNIDSYAATRTIEISTPVAISAIPYFNAYNGKTQTPVAYLHMYNAKGQWIGKHTVTVKKSFGNFKLSMGSTKIDDKKVHQVCLQLKNDVANTFSARYGVKSATYKVSTSSTGKYLYLSTK